MITIRATAFEASPADGGSATVEKGLLILILIQSIYLTNFFHIAPDAEINTEASEFLGQELSKLVLQNIFMLFILK